MTLVIADNIAGISGLRINGDRLDCEKDLGDYGTMNANQALVL